MSFKRAFTMAEAIIVMTILGIIATIMITNLKPTEFRDKGLQVLAKKVLMQLDTATQQIMVNNTQNGKLTTVYIPNSTTQVAFNAIDASNLAILYKKYLVTTRKSCTSANDCGVCYPTNTVQAAYFYLKDGACVRIWRGTSTGGFTTQFPGETNSISANVSYGGSMGFALFDVNGLDEPNVWGKDLFQVPINADGIFYD